jgi:hypothetical protein
VGYLQTFKLREAEAPLRFPYAMGLSGAFSRVLFGDKWINLWTSSENRRKNSRF